jgi:hypothetical protein
VNLHGGVVPFWNDRIRCRAVPRCRTSPASAAAYQRCQLDAL